MSEGTRPSATASSMLSSRTGWWRDDLLPRMQRIADQCIANTGGSESNPKNGWSGSVATLWQISVSRLAVMSRISLWRIVGMPPI